MTDEQQNVRDGVSWIVHAWDVVDEAATYPLQTDCGIRFASGTPTMFSTSEPVDCIDCLARTQETGEAVLWEGEVEVDPGMLERLRRKMGTP